MTTVRDLHSEAMSLAQEAMLARMQGDQDKAAKLAFDAFKLEAQAADMVPEGRASEPTRSILYRSAASLAYQCDRLAEAQRLIGKGLSGYPSPHIEQELKDLYEQINFESHLETRGIILEDTDLQLSMQGNAVGSGMIPYGEFMKRIENMRKLLRRTMQRLAGREYSAKGGYSKAYIPFSPVLSVPRAGSFAITIRLTYEEGAQMHLLFSAEQVINDVLTSFQLLNEAEEDQLQERMRSRGYFTNFVTLAREIAPDGERINYVGLTSRDRRVALSMQRAQIELPAPEELAATDVEFVDAQITGRLDLVESSEERERMRVTVDKDERYNLIVEEGFDDVMERYFKKRVVVKGRMSNNTIYMSDIQIAPDEEFD